MLIAVKLKPINDQRAFINCVKAGWGEMQDALGARCGSLVPVGAPWNGYKPEISRGFPRKDRFQKAKSTATRMRILR